MFTDAGAALVGFLLGAVLCLGGSVMLVSRIERLAGRLGVREATLGFAVALAADSPEIASAITATAHGQKSISVGVVLGSNAFNLATLLGLASIVAGNIALHRRVVVLEGSVALWVALVSVLLVSGALGAGVCLALTLLVLLPYLVVSSVSADGLRRLRLPARSVDWLRTAVEEEEAELGVAIQPLPSRRGDALLAVTSLLVVLGASISMEQAASFLGSRYNVSSIVIGAIVLAAATSLPNAVGAVLLARRGRGAAVLSETMNSNTLNVVAGLLLPASIAGLAKPSGQGLLVAGWYVGLTILGLCLAYVSRGLRRRAGVLIVAAYMAFVLVAATR